MGKVTAAKDVTLTQSASLTVPVPAAPFRIEVRFGPGVRGRIGFTPSR